MTVIDLDTWIVSDTHFGHANIVKYSRRPANHDELMAELWHASVQQTDTVLHLGDLAFRTADHMWDTLRRLPGKKLLILGNHDRKSKRWYEDLGFQIMPRRVFFNHGGKQILFTHRPEIEIAGWTTNVHGHLHNNGYHRDLDRSKDYRNVSVEVMGYRTVRLRDVLENGCYQSIRDAPISTHARR